MSRTLAATLLALLAGCGLERRSAAVVLAPAPATSSVLLGALRLTAERHLEPARVDPPDMLAGGLAELVGSVGGTVSPSRSDLILELDGRRAAVRRGASVDVRTVAGSLDAAVAWVAQARPAIPPATLEAAALRGAVRRLDRWSTAASGARRAEMLARFEGRLGGIGCRVGEREGAIRVLEVHASTPAADAGVREGDLIVAIGGEPAQGLPVADVVERMRGAPGSTVGLTVTRPGAADPVTFTLVRRQVVVPTVTSRLLAPGIGYLRITHLAQNTPPHVARAVEGLRSAPAFRGLILDLRGNSGGSMLAAAGIADQFVEEGVLLETRGRDGRPVDGLVHRVVARRGPPGERRGALVILVDGRTGSSAELLAAALAHHDRAVLLGARTFGKTVIQKMFPLERDVTLKLTVARAAAAGRAIPEQGIEPDLVVERHAGASRLPCGAGLPASPDPERALAVTVLARYGDPSRARMRSAALRGLCGDTDLLRRREGAIPKRTLRERLAGS